MNTPCSMRVLNQPNSTHGKPDMNVLTKALIAAVAVLAIGANASLAQTAPAKQAKVVKTAKSAPAKKTVKKTTVKKRRSAASLACSAQADTQGLRGKKRKVFRAKCLRTASKAGAKGTKLTKTSVKKAQVKKVAKKKTTAKAAKKKN